MEEKVFQFVVEKVVIIGLYDSFLIEIAYAEILYCKLFLIKISMQFLIYLY